MLQSTSSGTELLLRSQLNSSPVHNLRKSKITMMLAAALLVGIIIAVALAIAFRPKSPKQIEFDLHPAMARLALASITFVNATGIPSSVNSTASSNVPSDSVLGFRIVKAIANSSVAVAKDEYDELDKI